MKPQLHAKIPLLAAGDCAEEWYLEVTSKSRRICAWSSPGQKAYSCGNKDTVESLWF